VTAAMQNEQIRDNELYLKGLFDTSTGHKHDGGTDDGATIPNNVTSEQGARLVEAKTASASVDTSTATDIAVTWDNAFTTIIALSTETHYDGNMGGDIHLKNYCKAYSTTGATLRIEHGHGSTITIWNLAIAIGT